MELSGRIWKLLTSICPTLLLFQVLVKNSQMAGTRPDPSAFSSPFLCHVMRQAAEKNVSGKQRLNK